MLLSMRSAKIRQVAIASLFTAISVIICMAASLFPAMSLAIVALCGIATMIVILKCGYKYATLTYIASAVLIWILTPNKECAVYYTMLFGYYPLIRLWFERVQKRAVVVFLKTLLVNLLYIVVYLILKSVLWISEFTNTFEIITGAALFNIAFWLYDIFIQRCLFVYISKGSRWRRFR